MLSHSEKTAEQFGPLANAYLSSAVHSHGPELVTISEVAARIGARQVLDLGCGAGHVSFALAPHAESVIAYDLSEQMLQVVNAEAQRRGLANISIQQGRVERLPFAGKSFDMICSRYSAHHWQDFGKALGEAFRVLKPGGTLIAMDTHSTGTPLLDTHLQAIELLRDGSHVRNYTLAEWTNKLEINGFQIRSQSSWRIRLDFESWVKRASTPASHVDALRSLLGKAPQEVRSFFEIGNDGSFSCDTMLIEAGCPTSRL